MTNGTVGELVDRVIAGGVVTIDTDADLLSVSAELKSRLGTLSGTLGYQGPDGRWELCLIDDLAEIEAALTVGSVA